MTITRNILGTNRKITAGKLSENDYQELEIKDKRLWYAYEQDGGVYHLRLVNGHQVFVGTPWHILTQEQHNALRSDYFFTDTPYYDVNKVRADELYQSEGDKLHALWTACQKMNIEQTIWIYEAINIWLITRASTYHTRCFKRANNEQFLVFVSYALRDKIETNDEAIVNRFKSWLEAGALF